VEWSYQDELPFALPSPLYPMVSDLEISFDNILQSPQKEFFER
jgi:hypothetical protein